MRRVALALAVAVLTLVAQAAPTETQLPAPVAKAVHDAFQAAYNLDLDDSVTLARRAVTLWPDEPSAHRSLATMLWLQVLYRRDP
jgi:hypothetical protein